MDRYVRINLQIKSWLYMYVYIYASCDHAHTGYMAHVTLLTFLKGDHEHLAHFHMQCYHVYMIHGDI